MNKILEIYKKYKNGFYIFMVCLVVTLISGVFSKGEYYHYIKRSEERRVGKECRL